MALRRSLPYLLLSVLFLSLVASNIRVVSAATVVSISPLRVASVSWTPGTEFTVDIRITAVDDLFAWQVYLGWNATLLNATDIVEGPFLKQQPGGTSGIIVTRSEDLGQPEGFVFLQVTTLGAYEGVDGDIGTLASITFLVESYGGCPLDLYDTILLDSKFEGQPTSANEIPHSVSDGSFVNVGVPEAAFVYSPSFPIVNETVNFDASTSVDSDGSIVNYFWDFDDGTTFNATVATASHVFSKIKSYAVNLTVTDNSGLMNNKIVSVSARYEKDVAVNSISIPVAQVSAGQSVDVTVVVKNTGAVTVTFSVSLFNDGVSLDTETVTDLAPDATQTLTLTWNSPSDLAEGTYSLRAAATLDGDMDESNDSRSSNLLVKPFEQTFPTMLVIGIVAVAVVLVLAFFLLRRRGRKPAQPAAAPPS